MTGYWRAASCMPRGSHCGWSHRLKHIIPCAVIVLQAGCLQGVESSSGPQSTIQPTAIVSFGGHQSDCELATLAHNQRSEYGDYQVLLDNSWGQGVEVYLEQESNPMSVACSHPRRRLSGIGNRTRSAMANVDGRNPWNQWNQQQQNTATNQEYFRFIDRENRRYIAYEEQAGVCDPSTTGQAVPPGCVIWGQVQQDRRIRLVNGSCLGGYRISDVRTGVERNRLFPNAGVRDMRGQPIDQCFVLTRPRNRWPEPLPNDWGYRPPNVDDFDEPIRGIPDPSDRPYVAEVVVDAAFSVAQYKMCRDASPRNFGWLSTLACRMAGFSNFMFGYEGCIRQCRGLFEDKQWKMRNPGQHLPYPPDQHFPDPVQQAPVQQAPVQQAPVQQDPFHY
jgi:hypothetical protein